MRIDAYIGNPIIATQQDYYELENLSRRTLHYPRNPTIGWVADRLRNMVENGL